MKKGIRMKIGYQAVYDHDYYDAISYAAEHGFDYVQFDLNVPKFYLDELDNRDLDRIRGFTEEKQVGMSFHAPGDNISLFTDYPDIRQGILDHLSMIIAKAERLNARHVTVHPANYPAFRQANPLYDDFEQQYSHYYGQIFYENLRYLTATSETVMVCVENFKFTLLTMNTLETLFHNRIPVYLTWDLPKTYSHELECDETVEAFMLRNQDHIKEIHVHDKKKWGNSHQNVGQGDVDFIKYRELFSLTDVAVTIEVRPREEALKSRDTLLEVLKLSQ
jgi:sugar phosphate isomerase/epimerase